MQMRRRQTQPTTVGDLLAVQQKLKELPKIPSARAAEILGVSRRTIERWLMQKMLEAVPQGRGSWISVRSLMAVVEETYRPTAAFNIMRELKREL